MNLLANAKSVPYQKDQSKMNDFSNKFSHFLRSHLQQRINSKKRQKQSK